MNQQIPHHLLHQASPDPTESILSRGLENYWYALCPSTFVKESPVPLRRLGYKLALWRDTKGQVRALEDHCPHRGAPLSM